MNDSLSLIGRPLSPLTCEEYLKSICLFRVVKTHSKRMKMQELSRTALSYDQEEAKLKAKSDNRTWY